MKKKFYKLRKKDSMGNKIKFSILRDYGFERVIPDFPIDFFSSVSMAARRNESNEKYITAIGVDSKIRIFDKVLYSKNKKKMKFCDCIESDISDLISDGLIEVVEMEDEEYLENFAAKG